MIRALILDFDGTIYVGKDEVPGAAAFVERARAAGIRCLFVTNRANRPPADICAHVESYGIACRPDDVLTAAQATALYLEPGAVYHIGEEGLAQALAERGFTMRDHDVDYVVVSFDRQFDYTKLETACRLIDKGARFIATNPDTGLRTEHGIVPGTGAIVSAVSTGCGQEPTVIGKPEPHIVEMAIERWGLSRNDTVMVGDNLATDILAGARTGLRTALILTGISTREDLDEAVDAPTWVVETYEELWEAIQNDHE